jgi:FMN phosphatase YigB (HAD superfamily)
VIQALLIDLDHTLLQTGLDEFLPAYIDLLVEAVSSEVDVVDPRPILLSSTQAMIENQDPTRTLQQAFASRFYGSLGVTEEDLLPALNHFYSVTYPKLKDLTEPIPGGLELVERARKAGMKLGLATNPLFPLTAVEQRVEWAGISPAGDYFDVIASYESFHFTKPHPEYFAEMLGRLGIAADQAAMVGDDLRRDIEPAQTMGMHTFVVPVGSKDSDSLKGIGEWLDDLAAIEDESKGESTAAGVIARLRGYLAALLQLTPPAADEAWRERPSPREWSLLEIACHLRDTEREVNHARIRRMLTEEAPFISAVNPDEWAEERRYIDQDPTQAMQDFSRARTTTIAQLSRLPGEMWSATGRHSLLGPITLLELIEVATDHDLLHLDQFRRTIEQLNR